MTKSARIPELDGLRGLAILMVIGLHYISYSPGGELGSELYRFKALFRLGWSGVDLFFVLSGFLIGGILLKARESPNYFQAFYMRRVHRIFPIYYAWILLYLLIRGIGWIPSALPVATTSLHRLPFYLLFLQNLTSMPFGTFDWYWLTVTWSLAIEEQFYLVAPVVIRFLSRRSLFIALCSTILLAPVLRELVFRYASPDHQYWYVLMPCRADSLAMGMLAALAWARADVRISLLARKRSIYTALIVLFCGALVLLKYFPATTSHLTGVLGLSWLAFFYVTLLLAVLVDPAGKVAAMMRWKWLTRLGEISYCVYLIHLPVNALLQSLLLGSSKQSIATPAAVGVTLLSFACTVGIALLSWKYFEGPMVRLGHRYEYGMRKGPRRRGVLASALPED